MLTKTSSGPGFATERLSVVAHSISGPLNHARNLLIIDGSSGLLDDHSPLLLWYIWCHCSDVDIYVDVLSMECGRGLARFRRVCVFCSVVF